MPRGGRVPNEGTRVIGAGGAPAIQEEVLPGDAAAVRMAAILVVAI